MTLDQVQDPQSALFVRPIPNSIATGQEPIRFGGKPRLPRGTDWPSHVSEIYGEERQVVDHFIAEIDFSRLPRSVDGQKLPDMPSRGLLSLFLPLDADRMYAPELDVDGIFWTGDEAELIEVDPPEDLPTLLTHDYLSHIHEDGIVGGGKLLVRQVAEAWPFQSARAVNPLVVNLAEEGGGDVPARRQAHKSHELELGRVFAQIRIERPFPPPPEYSPSAEKAFLQKQMRRIPEEFRKFNWMLVEHHLDWAFIFDWSRAFFAGCLTLAIQEHRAFLKSGEMSNMMRRIMERRVRKLTALRTKTKARGHGKGRKPLFRVFDKPAPLDMNFDYQALRWLNLSQFQTDYPAEDVLAAFVDTLIELVCHYERTDGQGDNLGPRIWRLDASIDGHDAHAGNTLVLAKDAFKTACKRAEKRHKSQFDMMPFSDRWDSRVIRASGQSAQAGFSLGTMPLQMFGQGFEIQSAVSDHANDVL